MIVQSPADVLTTPTADIDTANEALVDDVVTQLWHGWQELNSETKAGLAANQIGLPYNAAIVQGKMMLNLSFIPDPAATSTDVEGCFSIKNAGEFFQVTRPISGMASWYDPVTKIQETHHVSHFAARVFQHELDHLQGRLCNQA